MQQRCDKRISSSMSDDVSNNRINKIAGPRSRTDLMKQPFKIYENLRSAVSVYRGHGSSSRSGVYQVRNHRLGSGRLLTHLSEASSSIKYQNHGETNVGKPSISIHIGNLNVTCHFHKKPTYQFDRNDDVLFMKSITLVG